jgi:hypothetical protein
MKNKTISFFILLFLIPLSILKSEKLTLNGSNQLEYSLQTDKYPAWRSFECWSEVVANYKWYNLGVRFEQHLPSDKDSVWVGLTLKYLQMERGDFDVILGDYYITLGKGLLLRSYEQRELRYDNNLEGAKLNWNRKAFDITFLWGKGVGGERKRRNPIGGVNLKLDALNWFKLGGTYLNTKPKDVGRTQLLGGNGEILIPHLNLYAELAEKYNPQNSFLPDKGKGIYLSSNIYSAGWGMSLEYKDYKNLDFSDEDLTYNQPPTLTKEHLYTLLNRNSHILDPTDEKGFQAEFNCSPKELANLVLNYSLTQNHQNKNLFSEIYLQTEYNFPDKVQVKGSWGLRESKEELGNPQRTFFASEITYYLNTSNALNFALEHLLTKNDGSGTPYSLIKFYEQIISLSFSHSPLYSVTLDYERTTQHSPKKNWFLASFDFNLDQKNNLSLGFGSRRAGKVCSGGMCTYKPELEGIEAKLLTRF